MEGDELKAWTPTMRQRAASALQNMFIKAGNDPYRAMGLAQQFTGGERGPVGGMGLADVTPLGLLFGSEEAGLQTGEGVAKLGSGSAGSGLLDLGLGLGGGLMMAAGPMGRVMRSPERKGAERAAEVVRSKRRVGTTGQYVGAPEGIDSPAAYSALVNHYVNAMDSGQAGRNFYKDSSKDIFARTGKDPVQADLLAQNLAILSRSNNVSGNTSMSAKAHIQQATGDPIRTGRFPSKDSPPLQAMYDAGQAEYLGHKRDPFATQLGVDWAPERVGRGVNDMHEAELMGYPSGKVGGATQHAFMDDVRARAIERANKMKLGGFDDWDTGTAQAAAWSGNKIRRGDIKPGEAAGSYADSFPLHESNATYEATVGRSAAEQGHLPGLLEAPWEQRQSFLDDPRGSWDTSPSGRDVGYTAAQMLPGETAAGTGRFQQAANPARVARPVVGTDVHMMLHPEGKLDKKGKPVMVESHRSLTPGSERAMNAVEASRAYWDAQDAGAWHKILPAARADNYTGATINFGRAFTEADMARVAPLFEARGYYLGTSPTGISVFARHANEEDKGTKVGAAFADEVRQIIKDNKPMFSGAKPEFGTLASGYIDLSEGRKTPGGAAKAMLERIDAAPKTAGLLEGSEDYRRAVVGRNARDAAFAKASGGTDPRMVLAREIFAKEGWPGIRRAAAAGTIPATLLGVGLAGEDKGLLAD